MPLRKQLSSATHSCHHDILLSSQQHGTKWPWTTPSENMSPDQSWHSYVGGSYPGTVLIRATTTYRLVIKFKWIMGPEQRLVSLRKEIWTPGTYIKGRYYEDKERKWPPRSNPTPPPFRRGNQSYLHIAFGFLVFRKVELSSQSALSC